MQLHKSHSYKKFTSSYTTINYLCVHIVNEAVQLVSYILNDFVDCIKSVLFIAVTVPHSNQSNHDLHDPA